MRIGGTVIQAEFESGGGLIGIIAPTFMPTLFPGACSGSPVSYIAYWYIGVWFVSCKIVIGLRVPKDIEP